MIIRKATLTDIDAIVAMQRVIHAQHLAWDAARWSTQTLPAAIYPEWLRELSSAAIHGLVLVAEVDARLVAYAVAEVEPESTRHWIPRCVYFHDLFVDPAHRGQGIARSLADAVLEWARSSHPALQVRLTTAAQNDAARRFFERLGFRACATEMLREPR